MGTQSGWNNKISTGSAITLNCGTNALNLSSDASAGAVNLATGGAAKVVTLGSTNSASSLDLQYGTADFSLASATGNVMVALDSGEITKPLQPAFLAYLSTTQDNVIGDLTDYVIVFDTEVYDQNSDYAIGTGKFTAPVTGRYSFSTAVGVLGVTTSHTEIALTFATSNSFYKVYNNSFGASPTVTINPSWSGSIQCDMDAADVVNIRIKVYNSTKTVDVTGSRTLTYFSGHLIC